MAKTGWTNWKINSWNFVKWGPLFKIYATSILLEDNEDISEKSWEKCVLLISWRLVRLWKLGWWSIWNRKSTIFSSEYSSNLYSKQCLLLQHRHFCVNYLEANLFLENDLVGYFTISFKMSFLKLGGGRLWDKCCFSTATSGSKSSKHTLTEKVQKYGKVTGYFTEEDNSETEEQVTAGYFTEEDDWLKKFKNMGKLPDTSQRRTTWRSRNKLPPNASQRRTTLRPRNKLPPDASQRRMTRRPRNRTCVKYTKIFNRKFILETGETSKKVFNQGPIPRKHRIKFVPGKWREKWRNGDVGVFLVT